MFSHTLSQEDNNNNNNNDKNNDKNKKKRKHNNAASKALKAHQKAAHKDQQKFAKKLEGKVTFFERGEGKKARLVVCEEVSAFIFGRILGFSLLSILFHFYFMFYFIFFAFVFFSFFNIIFSLEFLYTGFCQISDSSDFVEDTKKAADLFNCTELSTICTNIAEVCPIILALLKSSRAYIFLFFQGNEFLNPSIGTFLNDQNGQHSKELFLNKPKLSDLHFTFKGRKGEGEKERRVVIPAHICFVAPRCSPLKKDILKKGKKGEGVVEVGVKGDLGVEVFKSLLEFLYTDHAPILAENNVDLMLCAARFGVTRLVSLCEVSYYDYYFNFLFKKFLSLLILFPSALYL